MICSRSHRLMTVLENETRILRNTKNWPIILFFVSATGICDWKRNLSFRTVKLMREQVQVSFTWAMAPFSVPFYFFRSCWVCWLVCFGGFLAWVFWGAWQTIILPAAESIRTQWKMLVSHGNEVWRYVHRVEPFFPKLIALFKVFSLAL